PHCLNRRQPRPRRPPTCAGATARAVACIRRCPFLLGSCPVAPCFVLLGQSASWARTRARAARHMVSPRPSTARTALGSLGELGGGRDERRLEVGHVAVGRE